MNSTLTRSYTRVAVWLHWTIAALIAFNFVAVWVAEDMARPERMQVMANHKAVGITILVLSVARILWRITHTAPPFEPTLKRWEIVLARANHTLFYILMIGMPLTGWAMVSGGGPVGWFGLFDVPALPVPTNKAAGDAFHETHETLAWLLLALIVLHVAGALKHHIVNRDGTLARMVPFLRRGGLS